MTSTENTTGFERLAYCARDSFSPSGRARFCYRQCRQTRGRAASVFRSYVLFTRSKGYLAQELEGMATGSEHGACRGKSAICAFRECRQASNPRIGSRRLEVEPQVHRRSVVASAGWVSPEGPHPDLSTRAPAVSGGCRLYHSAARSPPWGFLSEFWDGPDAPPRSRLECGRARHRKKQRSS